MEGGQFSRASTLARRRWQLTEASRNLALQQFVKFRFLVLQNLL
jgi:hypothetical protein